MFGYVWLKLQKRTWLIRCLSFSLDPVLDMHMQ